MKPYGMNRAEIRDSDDLAGIKRYGMKSSWGNPRGKGGAIRAGVAPTSKATARRYQHRRARAANKRACAEEI